MENKITEEMYKMGRYYTAKAVYNIILDYAAQFKQTEQCAGVWKLIGHSYQIADTGDYDGQWEITDGKIKLFTEGGDYDEEEMQEVVDLLNGQIAKFIPDESPQSQPQPTSLTDEDIEKDWNKMKERMGNLNYQGLINIDDLVKIIGEFEDKHKVALTNRQQHK